MSPLEWKSAGIDAATFEAGVATIGGVIHGAAAGRHGEVEAGEHIAAVLTEDGGDGGGTGGAVFGLRVSKHKHDHVIDEMLGIKIGHEVVEVLGGAGKG